MRKLLFKHEIPEFERTFDSQQEANAVGFTGWAKINRNTIDKIYAHFVNGLLCRDFGPAWIAFDGHTGELFHAEFHLGVKCPSISVDKDVYTRILLKKYENTDREAEALAWVLGV